MTSVLLASEPLVVVVAIRESRGTCRLLFTQPLCNTSSLLSTISETTLASSSSSTTSFPLCLPRELSNVSLVVCNAFLDVLIVSGTIRRCSMTSVLLASEPLVVVVAIRESRGSTWGALVPFFPLDNPNWASWISWSVMPNTLSKAQPKEHNDFGSWFSARVERQHRLHTSRFNLSFSASSVCLWVESLPNKLKANLWLYL